jgi:hypothetical protein
MLLNNMLRLVAKPEVTNVCKHSLLATIIVDSSQFSNSHQGKEV